MTDADIDIIAHKMHQYQLYQNSIHGMIEQMEKKINDNLSVINNKINNESNKIMFEINQIISHINSNNNLYADKIQEIANIARTKQENEIALIDTCGDLFNDVKDIVGFESNAMDRLMEINSDLNNLIQAFHNSHESLIVSFYAIKIIIAFHNKEDMTYFIVEINEINKCNDCETVHHIVKIVKNIIKSNKDTEKFEKITR